jgi:hypothetical protein
MSRERNSMELLVVGDWVIDDYWATGIHRSATASRIGKAHLRALNKPGTIVSTFAGAGRVASLLRYARLDQTEKISICGVGFWHREDTKQLKALFRRENLGALSPYRISRPDPPDDPENKIHLLNIADCLELPADSHGTTRVVRINRQRGSALDLEGRIDWEVHLEDQLGDEHVWLTEANMLGFEQNFDKLARRRFDGIVVKDLRKGVVSKALVEWLVDRFPRTPWFVSSKQFRPEWLNSLQPDTLRLYLVPDLAAQDAVHKGIVNSWFTDSKRLPRQKPTREALEAINDIFKDLQNHNRLHVIVMPNGFRTIARTQKKAVCQPDAAAVPFNKHAAMASACFPALVAGLLHEPRIDLEKLVSVALGFTQEFNQREALWFEKPTETSTTEAGPIELPWPEKRGSFPSVLETLIWTKELANWKAATERPGIIDGNSGERRIELWRAMTEIDGYVCCCPEKRKRLAQLLTEIRDFERRRERRSLSGMLIANPGSGKTSLVRSLANAVSMQFLDFNITQMIGRDELFACFDTIITTHAQDRSRPVLVFFDEINAKLGNQFVYDAFLSPLEDGLYSRGGRKYVIPPCVWIFAGTARPSDPTDKSNKASDFASRLTMEEIDLTTTSEPLEKFEGIYRGVAMIQTAFPDVRQISRKFLEAMYRLKPEVTARELRNYLKNLEGVQYGRVAYRNIPPTMVDKFLLDRAAKDARDDEWIKIA